MMVDGVIAGTKTVLVFRIEHGFNVWVYDSRTGKQTNHPCTQLEEAQALLKDYERGL
jgi:hypothetical protein